METIRISGAGCDPVLMYAAEELQRFLEAGTGALICREEAADTAADWLLQLRVDPKLPRAAFGIGLSERGACRRVTLSGQDASATLAAVYTLLEQAGMCFDVLGPIYPARLRLTDIKAVRVVPPVIERGIRQHINFPMDISSYPLAEACDYIRNLARLRFNQITFHSYPGQWYVTNQDGKETLAGHFFYDVRHDVPEHPVVGPALRNRRVFAIPEIEPVFDDAAARSEAAMAWLRSVMREARRVGMRVQFSMEIREADPEAGAKACADVLQAYPEVETLELITPENEHEPVRCLERYLAVLALLRNRPLGRPQPGLAVGIYETSPEYLMPGIAYLREHCPADIEWTMLPAHGARAVADSMRKVGLRAADWRRTRLYSWVEFDGLMFTQQNALQGSREAVDLIRSVLGKGRIAAVAFNHWRTAENRAAIRFAALACLDADLTPAAFSRDYARALGIGNRPAFVKSMLALDEVDTYCRNHLFNIGFCHLGCWRNPKGLGWTTLNGWTRDSIAEASARMQQVSEGLLSALEATRRVEGRQWLRLMLNRLACTQWHLAAVDALLELRSVCEGQEPGALPARIRAQVRKYCDLADTRCEQYMRLHATALPDRGSEGTLISYYETLPRYIQHIRGYYLGEAQGKGTGDRVALDAPPPPETVGANQ